MIKLKNKGNMSDEKDRKRKHVNQMIKGRTVFTTRIFTQRKPCPVR